MGLSKSTMNKAITEQRYLLRSKRRHTQKKKTPPPTIRTSLRMHTTLPLPQPAALCRKEAAPYPPPLHPPQPPHPPVLSLHTFNILKVLCAAWACSSSFWVTYTTAAEGMLRSHSAPAMPSMLSSVSTRHRADGEWSSRTFSFGSFHHIIQQYHESTDDKNGSKKRMTREHINN